MAEDKRMLAQGTRHSALSSAVEAEDERSEDETGTADDKAGPQASRNVPDPEVPAKPSRRRFTAEYKLRILAEVESCSGPGAIGRLLRREGLYSSHLTAWRRARDVGALRGLTPKKRGRKPRQRDPVAKKLAEMERKNAALEEELRKARIIISVQKKVAALFDDEAEAES